MSRMSGKFSRDNLIKKSRALNVARSEDKLKVAHIKSRVSEEYLSSLVHDLQRLRSYRGPFKKYARSEGGGGGGV